ncbi:Zn-dependent oligopeptidase [Methanoplanus sp. FWC-SCC4]|uniref:Zn-dependent oligopeptidase n=1 Tax=Methanochimaera problematica TaxID=2609417 RepID=A0AA97FFC4_9EURY|nr:M3 family metallopeptidase [Methanoplanus sp. FWC-SCC4]WOF17268.1 Zn-dependent oligopeptidase [Methanoplanus sp. FWC-SCC4]
MPDNDSLTRFCRVFSTLIIAFILVMSAGCIQSSPAESDIPVVTSTTGPIQTEYSHGEITRLAGKAQADANESFNQIAAILPEERNFDNTVLAFEETVSDHENAIFPLTLMRDLHPDPEIAAEGQSADESYKIFLNDVMTRPDLYDALKGQNPRTGQESRLYNKILSKFEKSGLGLSDERRSKLRGMNNRLVKLESEYILNLNNDNTTLEFTAADLSGLSAEVLSGFSETESGNYTVTMTYPNLFSVIISAENEETRKKMYQTFFNVQADENIPVLEEALDLRRSIAEEAGFLTWADYKLDNNSMAKDSAGVMTFLNTLKAPLQNKTTAELEELLAVKKTLDPKATSVNPWDVYYLREKIRKQDYDYDKEEVREYFPMERVLSGLFDTCSALFGVSFEEVSNPSVWSPDVRLFEVSNMTDNKTIGYLYLDLYKREGKVRYTYTSGIINGRIKNGTYTTPVVVIVDNLRPPAGDKPSLLSPVEMETLFHETGHAMHGILTEVPYGILSGANVDFDFSELPSMTLEEWVWDPQVLESLSGHYKNTSKKIPAELCDIIIEDHFGDPSYFYSVQLIYSLEDMRFHTARGRVNATEIWSKTNEEMTGMHDTTRQPARFDYMMDGSYDAAYYGYLWSEANAFNIVDEFKKDGMLNRTTGMRLRNEILSKGNMEDGSVLLENFLGKEPGPEALYKVMGIDVAEA